MKFALNDRFILEAYKTDKSLQAKVSSGFATVAQKTALKGLKVLVGTTLSDGREVPAGAIAYIKEQFLHNQPWATAALDCESIKGQFIVVEKNFIDFIEIVEGSLRFTD